jgi:hypothetical protein
VSQLAIALVSVLQLDFHSFLRPLVGDFIRSLTDRCKELPDVPTARSSLNLHDRWAKNQMFAVTAAYDVIPSSGANSQRYSVPDYNCAWLCGCGRLGCTSPNLNSAVADGNGERGGNPVSYSPRCPLLLSSDPSCPACRRSGGA